jgi:hypothetical protein
MRKVILGVAVLTVLVSLVHSQEILCTSDLLNGILIDGKDTLLLKDGEYRDPSDSEADYYQININAGFYKFSSDLKSSIALTIMECPVGGNGRTYRTAYATKNNGTTRIWMGGDYGESKSTIMSFVYTGTINIYMQQSDYDARKLIKVFDIKNNVPVFNPTRSRYLN